MSKRDIALLIEDILVAGNRILSYTAGMDYDQFIADSKTIDAVVRNFEIIGEASRRIPEDFKLEHPEIQWREIVDFRNRIIHEYYGVDYEVVWTIKEEYLPGLIEWLNDLSSK